jgi:hypothetical protein
MKKFPRRLSLSTVQGILFLLAAGLAYGGEHFSLTILTNLGLLVIGLLVGSVGVGLIVTNLAAYDFASWSNRQAIETYRGLVEQLWGLVIAGLGLFMIGLSASRLLAPARGDTWWNALLASPAAVGVALGTIGLMTSLNGLIRVLTGSASGKAGKLAGVADILDEPAGIAMLVFGWALTLASLVLLVAPDVVTALIRQLGTMIVGP